MAFPHGGEPRYFEDYATGLVVEFGDEAVTESSIVAFARRYDPQDFHVDPARAATGPFGGLVASGWQTAGLMTRMLTQHYLSPASSLGSPGIDELRWPAPVRPGDRLSVRLEILEARRSRSKPDRGLVISRIAVRNQAGADVMTLKLVNLIRARA